MCSFNKEHEFYKKKICNEVPPHIFWTADRAYQRMIAEKTRQCIVISGESGSGKTESTKLIVEHIIYLCKNNGENSLEKKILDVNTLLEAFGNAQTTMNSNSSRFGKYLKMYFTNDGKILGAKVFDYLLEKSRVVQHGIGERNYHIFYYLFHGLTKTELDYYYLDSPIRHR
jgi:myosin heavy subunit